MFIQAIYSTNEKHRPKSGWLMFQKTEEGQLIPLLSQREKQIKVKTLDQVLAKAQKNVPDSLHAIKIEYISSDGLFYGTVFFDPSKSLKDKKTQKDSDLHK